MVLLAASPIEVAAASVIAPLAVAAEPELVKAPALLIPEPDRLSALATL